MRGEISFPVAKAERLRHALMTMMAACHPLGQEFDQASFEAAGIQAPKAMETIVRAAAQDEAEEWAELIGLLETQTLRLHQVNPVE